MKTRAIFGQKELGDLLGLSKQALQWRLKHGSPYSGSSIPEPDYRVSATRLWTYETIKKSKIVTESELNEFVQKMNQMSLEDLTG